MSNAAFDFNVTYNQPPALENYNLFETDAPLRDAINANRGSWINARAAAFGAQLGSTEYLELGNLANRFAPELKTHDRFGNRLDTIEYHPAYHELLRHSIENEMHSLTWQDETRTGRYVVRCALMYLRHQVDEGTSCPLTMTFAVVPSLKLAPELAARWMPRVLSNEYDPRFLPAEEKRGAMFGMAMTEPQGGSDVRANLTRAERIVGADGEYFFDRTQMVLQRANV